MDDLLPYSPETHVLWNEYATAVMAFLIEEGLEPWLDEEADVYFRHQEELYLLATHTADPRSFQLIRLPLYALPDWVPRLQVHEAVAYAQQQTHAGRLIVLDAYVQAEVTHLLPNDEAWRSVFWKSLEALVKLGQAFRSRLSA